MSKIAELIKKTKGENIGIKSVHIRELQADAAYMAGICNANSVETIEFPVIGKGGTILKKKGRSHRDLTFQNEIGGMYGKRIIEVR